MPEQKEIQVPVYTMELPTSPGLAMSKLLSYLSHYLGGSLLEMSKGF